TADNTPPSPLLDASLPPWMKLHFQLDPETGWESPQVLSQDAAARLRESWPGVLTTNATPERAECLAACRQRFPAPQASVWLFSRERLAPEPTPALPAPSSPPTPGTPLNVSSNGRSTTEALPKDAAPPVPPADVAPALGEKADLSRGRSAETYGFL